jgi:hypothetical protein
MRSRFLLLVGALLLGACTPRDKNAERPVTPPPGDTSMAMPRDTLTAPYGTDTMRTGTDTTRPRP